MISGRGINLYFGDRILFDNIEFTIRDGGKYGLVGRNGTGKTTLLKILTGEIVPQEGQVDFPGHYTLGYLSQHLTVDETLTVRENASLAFSSINKTEAKLESLNEALSTREDYESEAYHDLIQQIADLTDRLSYLGVENREAEIEKVLKGLGFTSKTFDKLTGKLSGGWKMRVQLAQILLSGPSVLLLDEPTNHLDIDSIIWLEKFLKNYPGIVILISHDRQFLDNIITDVYELHRGHIEYYPTNYSGYLIEKEERVRIRQAAYENQQKLIADKQRTIERFRAKATKASMAQSMEKSLDKMEKIDEVVEDHSQVSLSFLPVRRSANEVSKVINAGKSFGTNQVFDNVSMEILRGERVAFVGQNGQGKSTLTKIIVGEWEPSEGTVTLGNNVDLGYFAQNQVEFLPGNETPLSYMESVAPANMRTKVRTILGSFLFSGEEVEKKIKVLSGGEKTRLALARLLLKPINFLVLDEPTHHLDMQTKAILKNGLESFEGTLLVVSHDRDLLAGLTEKTYEFRNGEVKEYLGDIEYFLMKREEDDMRAIEKGDQASSKKAAPLSKEERIELFERKKFLKNQINKQEKSMQRIEKKIQSCEKDMMDPEFYQSKNAAEVTQTHHQLKSELDEVMESWAHLMEEMEALDEG
ncbi:ABC-F family ATP-binding cassette domain-containing protein [Membranicola marinus]|uniref:Probable ATP-binding protein YbiT n=1 Tax=Membranihabitans marinus TaxID=1227546 RepID=A0A953LD32_9BACT|nr:ABC-F family ATP-binding cassette domain-containing protein [Membranihabitans marinus]MBY5958424.1 ABC-F family ATP-binding cassette domain-containing protein [Membranihabitans marinus]